MDAVRPSSNAAPSIWYADVATPHWNVGGRPAIGAAGRAAEVVVGFWGSSNMDPATVSGMGGFYTAVLGSPFMDELTEYNTTGLSAANPQTIGHGTLKGTYTIKLSAGGQELTQPLTILKDPASAGTEADIRTQTAMLRDLQTDLESAWGW